MSAPVLLTVNTRVRLHGLKNQAQLNGATGVVCGSADADTGRIPVQLIAPPAAVKGFPGGVKLLPANLEVLENPEAPVDSSGGMCRFFRLLHAFRTCSERRGKRSA